MCICLWHTRMPLWSRSLLRSFLVCRRRTRGPAGRDFPPGDGYEIFPSLWAGGPLPQVQPGTQHPPVPAWHLPAPCQQTPSARTPPNPLPLATLLPPPPPLSPPPPPPSQGAGDGSGGSLRPPDAQWSDASRNGFHLPYGGRGCTALSAGSLHVQSRGWRAACHGWSTDASFAGRRDFQLTYQAFEHLLALLWPCRRLVSSCCCLFKYHCWPLISVSAPPPFFSSYQGC